MLIVSGTAEESWVIPPGFTLRYFVHRMKAFWSLWSNR